MDGSFLEAPVYRYLKCNWRSSSFSRSNCKGQVRSGGHPKGPSGHGCCSDVLPPFSVSNQLPKSNSVSPCGNAIQWQTSPFQILFYIVHPSLLWASNWSFSCWLPIMNYGWPPFFVHSGDYVHTISFSFSEQYFLLFSALSLLAPSHCLLYPHIKCAVSDAAIDFCMHSGYLHDRCQAPGFAPV